MSGEDQEHEDEQLPPELSSEDHMLPEASGSGYAGQLSGLSEPPPDGMAVPDHVWPLVDAWPTYLRDEGTCGPGPDGFPGDVHQACSACHQSVRPVSKAGVAYGHSDEQVRGLKLAHLIQAHDWTREGPADGEGSPES